MWRVGARSTRAAPARGVVGRLSVRGTRRRPAPGPVTACCDQGHGRDKRGPPVWGRAISLRNSSGRHAACRRAKYPRRPGAWRCGVALRAGYTPISHAVGGAGTSRTGASSIGNSSSSSNFTIFHLDETAGLVIRLNRRREMFRLGGRSVKRMVQDQNEEER